MTFAVVVATIGLTGLPFALRAGEEGDDPDGAEFRQTRWVVLHIVAIIYVIAIFIALVEFSG